MILEKFVKLLLMISDRTTKETNYVKDYICDTDLSNLRDLRFESGKIGVTYYPDVQRFIARLRLNLKRHYNYALSKLIVVPRSRKAGRKRIFRPHFPHLLSCRKGDFKT